MLFPDAPAVSALAAIDIESHLVPPALLHACQAAAPGSPGSILAAMYADANPATHRELLDLSAHLAAMDGCGVGLSVLSAPLLPSYRMERGELAALTAAINDELLEAAGAHPGRFAVLATLPFPFADACVAELDRLSGEPLVLGAIAHCAMDGWTLDDRSLDAVYEQLSQRALPLMLHPGSSEGMRLEPLREWGLANSIGTMVETTTMAARMVLSGTLDRNPQLAVLVPHLGGLLPYLAQRMVDLNGRGRAEHDLPYYLRERLLYDTCSLHRPALDCAVATTSVERLLLGSDYPYRGALRRAIDDITESGLEDAEQRAVLRHNALRHFVVPSTTGAEGAIRSSGPPPAQRRT
jgi:predicted TIM-barrel fold metal-dependent hydrolase